VVDSWKNMVKHHKRGLLWVISTIVLYGLDRMIKAELKIVKRCSRAHATNPCYQKNYNKKSHLASTTYYSTFSACWWTKHSNFRNCKSKVTIAYLLLLFASHMQKWNLNGKCNISISFGNKGSWATTLDLNEHLKVTKYNK